MANIWELIIDNSTLPDEEGYTLWDHLNNQQEESEFESTGQSCGIGVRIGNTPLPADPNINSQTIMAKAVFGGIQVSWTYPNINPHALSHVVVYRSTTAVFGDAAQIAVATGDNYFDAADGLTEGVGYYYWISMVSINGTIGDELGPALAVMSPTVEDIIAILQGKIENSVLSQELLTTIGGIGELETALTAEEQARLLGNQTITDLVAAAQASLDGIDTLLLNEITQRVDGDSALVSQINAVLAIANGNTAAVLQESQARVDGDAATANLVTSLESDFDNSIANINNELSTQATTTSALATELETFSTQLGAAETLITNETIARSNADGAFTQQISTLQAELNGATASLQTNSEAVADVEDGLSTSYTVKSDINGYVTGFGLFSDGSDSQFIVHAADFAVGQPGYGSVKYPFIISTVNGVSTIAIDAQTFIKDLSVNTFSIANEAVTVPRGGDIDPFTSLGNFWSTLGSIPVPFGSGNSASSGIVVMAFGSYQTVGIPTITGDVSLRVVIDGWAQGEVAQTVFSTLGGNATIATAAFYSGLTGTRTVSVQMKNASNGTILARNSGAVIMGFKK